MQGESRFCADAPIAFADNAATQLFLNEETRMDADQPSAASGRNQREVRVKESKSRKEGVRVETATFGLFDFSTPAVNSSKNSCRKQNFEAFVLRIVFGIPLCRIVSGVFPLSVLIRITNDQFLCAAQRF